METEERAFDPMADSQVETENDLSIGRTAFWFDKFMRFFG